MRKSEQVRRALKNWRAGKYASHGMCYCLAETNAGIVCRDSWYNEISQNHLCGHNSFVDVWLFKQGISIKLLTKENMREYRELWLEHLVKYYEEKGD